MVISLRIGATACLVVCLSVLCNGENWAFALLNEARSLSSLLSSIASIANFV